MLPELYQGNGKITLTFFCAIRFGWRDVGIKVLVVQKAPSKEWESPRTTGLLESQYRSAQGGAESQSGASREGCTVLFDSMTYAETEVKDSCFECGRECAFQTDADGRYVCGFPAVAPTAGPACRRAARKEKTLRARTLRSVLAELNCNRQGADGKQGPRLHALSSTAMQADQPLTKKQIDQVASDE